MKHIVGGIVGAVITAVAVFGWTGRAQETDVVWTGAGERQQTQLAALNAPAAPPAWADPLNLTCEPGQRAVIRRAPGAGGTATEAACVTDGGFATWQPPRPFEATHVAAPAQTRPPSYSAAPQVAPARIVYRDRDAAPRRVDSGRSWKKTALVIGGSAGAGAGVGALAGGKKGALIGAAVGGGAASIYEAIKRK